MSNDKNISYTKVAFISLSVYKDKNFILIREIFKDFFLKFLSLKFRTLIPFRHCKDKNFILIYKIFREKFLLKMNFIILRIIFRKYLHISKILLFAHYLLSKIFIKFPLINSGRPKLPARCLLYNTCMITD